MTLNCIYLGKRIQQKRKELKISQLKFAEMIDKSPTFVSLLERGEKGPSLDTLILIADALQTSVDALISESRTTYPQNNMKEMTEILSDCIPYERYILLHSMKSLKSSLREGEVLYHRDKQNHT